MVDFQKMKRVVCLESKKVIYFFPLIIQTIYEPRHEKTNVLVSDLVRHKPGCTASEDGKRLEISNLESRGIVYILCSENKSADQLRGYREADLRLCFRICKTLVFS